MSFYSIAPFIEKYYPEYYTLHSYPIEESIVIRKVKDQWGILGNFARTPIIINNIIFKSAEQLFQVLKFTECDAVKTVYNANNPKMTAKHLEKTHRRQDWGSMIIDAMKFCLVQKYNQSEAFRSALDASKGKYIVEDQSSFNTKQANTWGVKLIEGEYCGSNLLGRLLMELRDNGTLDYKLPDDTLSYLTVLKS